VPPLRVLHVAHGWPPGATGGTERYAALLVREQAALGAQVGVYAPGAPGWQPLPSARGFAATWDHPGVTDGFRARVRGVDVVHVHHLAGLALGLPAEARAAGARVVLTLHDYWLRCARGQLVDHRLRSCEGPTPARCARCLAPAIRGPIPGVRALPPAVEAVTRRDAAVDDALRHVDLLLSPSPHLPARLGLDAEVLPLPVDAPPPAAEGPPGPVRFAFVGALLPTKGPDRVVEAFAGLPAGAGTLDLYGATGVWDGAPWGAGLGEGVPGVARRGHVDPVPWDEVDVLVFASIWDENHPLVLAEARAAGVRVVAADVPGARLVAPEARFFARGSVPGLRAALAAEVRWGQVRRSPQHGPAPAAHAAELLRRYERLRSGA